MNYLLYQAYGHEDVLHETIYSLISFYDVCQNSKSEIQIYVYTDSISKFDTVPLSDLKINFIEIPQPTFKEWYGEISMIHRFKIKMLQDFFTKFNGNVLYIDSDTTFKKDILPVFESIARNNLFLHLSEGKMKGSSNLLNKKIYNYLTSNASTRSIIKLDSNIEMWNAGAIGMNSSKAFLLDEVLNYTDTLYKLYPKHTMEQFAFSFVFQRHGVVNSLDDYIFHYWNFKEFRATLKRFFQKYNGYDLSVLKDIYTIINPEKLGAPKMRYLGMNTIVRGIWKLRKKKWQLPFFELPDIKKEV